MSGRAHIALALAFLLMGGCGTPRSSFQATWFMTDESRTGDSKMFVTILNQSTDVHRIQEVILNREGTNNLTGWKLKTDLAAHKVQLEPGKVFVRSIVDFEKSRHEESGGQNEWRCRLPVSVVILTGKDRESLVEFQAELVGRMPSALPKEWEAGCPKT